MIISFKKIIEGKLKVMGFRIVSAGKDGILARRISTGKFISVTYKQNLRPWTKFKVHPFTILLKQDQLVFRDELNGDLVTYI